MIERHFAFFRQRTGEYIREWKGPVPEPNIDPLLVGDAREIALNQWVTDVSQPQPGEIGLDVTQFDYPVGDFCWMVFRQPEWLLDWPVMHRFIQIDRATMTINVNNESHRPVRSTPNKLVIDITGTAMEPYYGAIFGTLVVREGRWWLEPIEADMDVHGLSVPIRTPLALTERPIDLALPVLHKEVVLA